MNTIHTRPVTTPADLALSRVWTGQFTTHLPFSFRYEGQIVRGIPDRWNPVTKRRRINANIIETIIEGMDSATGLNIRFEWFEYLDFPVVEWTVWFQNHGEKPTGMLSDILSIDTSFKGAPLQNQSSRNQSSRNRSSGIIHHCNGDFYNENGYTPQETPLSAGDRLDFAPNGGRACDGAFPYYRVLFNGCGLTMAIGWPGQWAVHFQGLADGIQIQAGQEKTHLSLLPGEIIRTPRMTIMSWIGDTDANNADSDVQPTRAINLWRRWYLAHILPRPDGQPLKPKLAVCGPEEGEEFTAATEENQLRNIARFKDLGFNFDVWWIDAGWYPCYNLAHERKWWITGTWEPDPERFPTGLKPVSEYATQNGADLLVWFEPERVQPGARLEREHPEWLLRIKGNENSLFYLGNPECRRWLTEHVCRLIQDNGIKIYRQDFNFEPLEHWRSNDAPDRQGMNENLHIQGYLQYWDDLLARNPGLWIDSCASGGRRNDLETMRRAVPLHYTDYGYGYHPVKLAFHHTLYAWIPYFKEATLSWDLTGPERFDRQIDQFSFQCGMAAMLFATIDIRRKDYDFPLAQKMIDIWRRASEPLLNGDYYPLTPFHRKADQWVGWQFDQPEIGQGFIQGIRLPECPEEKITFFPKGLSPDSPYLLENPETGEMKELSGISLINTGFTFALPKRSAAIWFYRIKKEALA